MWKYILVLFFCTTSFADNFKVELKNFVEKVEKQKNKQEIKKIVEDYQSSLKKLEGTKDDPDDAIVLRFALDLVLTVQTYTPEECLSAKLAHFTSFGVKSSDLLNPSDLPDMVKISYGVLNRMCNLKE